MPLPSIGSWLAVDRRGTLWLGGFEPQLDRGAYLFFYDGSGWINKAPVELSQSDVIALSVSPDGEPWVSTKQFGVSLRRDDDSWVQYTKLRTSTDPAGLSYFSYMFGLLIDSRGFLWCNTLNFDLDRVAVNDPAVPGDDVWTHYALNTGTITSNRYVRIREDPAGNRWFLSDNDVEGLWGIDILSADGTSWLAVNPSVESRMAGGVVFDVAFGANGTAYLALRNYGLQAWMTGGYDWAHLSSLAADGWSTPIGPEDLASKVVYCCERGTDGTLWLGTASGLMLADTSGWKSLRYGNRLPIGPVGSLAFDEEGDLFCSILGQGAAIYSFGRVRTFGAGQGAPGLYVRAFSLDPSTRRMWAAGADGVFVYDGAEWTRQDLPGIDSRRRFLSMKHDAEGTCYLGTDDGAVVVLSDGAAREIRVPQAFPERRIARLRTVGETVWCGPFSWAGVSSSEALNVRGPSKAAAAAIEAAARATSVGRATVMRDLLSTRRPAYRKGVRS